MALSGLYMPNRLCLDRCEFGSVLMGPNKPIELYLLSFTFFLAPFASRRRHASAVAAAVAAVVAVAVIASAVAFAVVATASLHFLVRSVRGISVRSVRGIRSI